MNDFEKLDIVDYISNFVELEECGETTPYYKGLCPFHDDHAPSFIVYPKPKGRFICFACGESGDVIDFCRKFYKCSFEEAKRQVTTKIDPVDSLGRLLKQEEKATVDLVLFSKRIYNLLKKDVTLHSVVELIDKDLDNGNYWNASRRLSRYGV